MVHYYTRNGSPTRKGDNLRSSSNYEVARNVTVEVAMEPIAFPSPLPATAAAVVVAAASVLVEVDDDVSVDDDEEDDDVDVTVRVDTDSVVDDVDVDVEVDSEELEVDVDVELDVPVDVDVDVDVVPVLVDVVNEPSKLDASLGEIVCVTAPMVVGEPSDLTETVTTCAIVTVASPLLSLLFPLSLLFVPLLRSFEACCSSRFVPSAPHAAKMESAVFSLVHETVVPGPATDGRAKQFCDLGQDWDATKRLSDVQNAIVSPMQATVPGLHSSVAWRLLNSELSV